MSSLFKCITLIVIFVLVLSVVKAEDKEADLEAFKSLKNDIFGPKYDGFVPKFLSQKIRKMLTLLQGGNIPAEVQGEITYEFLRDLITDCAHKETCHLEEDLARVDRLKKRENGAPDFLVYLDTCTFLIFKGCASVVYKHASEKLRVLSEEDWGVLGDMSSKVEERMRPSYEYRYFQRARSQRELDYHEIVLEALRARYPKDSNKVAKKWIKREKALRKLMDRIRKPCAIFVENLDPIAADYPSDQYAYSNKDPLEELMLWSFYKKSCQEIVDNWENIVQNSFGDYEEYLADLKPYKSSSCFGGGYSGGGGGGITTGTLIKISAGRWRPVHLQE